MSGYEMFTMFWLVMGSTIGTCMAFHCRFKHANECKWISPELSDAFCYRTCQPTYTFPCLSWIRSFWRGVFGVVKPLFLWSFGIAFVYCFVRGLLEILDHAFSLNAAFLEAFLAMPSTDISIAALVLLRLAYKRATSVSYAYLTSHNDYAKINV